MKEGLPKQEELQLGGIIPAKVVLVPHHVHEDKRMWQASYCLFLVRRRVQLWHLKHLFNPIHH